MLYLLHLCVCHFHLLSYVNSHHSFVAFHVWFCFSASGICLFYWYVCTYFEMVFFSIVAKCLSICWALSWWMETSTESAFSVALCWRFCAAFAYGLSLSVLFCLVLVFLNTSKPLISSKLSHIAFCYCLSTLLAQDKTCSFVTSLISFISVNSLIMSAVILLSLISLMNCSFSR